METKTELEIIVFEDKNWSEIPEQDNPTYDLKRDPQKGIIRKNECLLICKVLPYEAENVGNGGYGVFLIPEKRDIKRLGLFWELKNAKLFAEAFSKQ